MQLIIVSGTSGSGKSIALHALEDLGFYCVDNLPVNLLPALMDELETQCSEHTQKTAIGIDARTICSQGGEPFSPIITTLEREAIRSELIFLDASDKVLGKRFSETRRRHPLSRQKGVLIEAITAERELLRPLAKHASLVIDSSDSHIHQLRKRVQRHAGVRDEGEIALLFESFGFKFGIPVDADFVFDVRALPNPHWIPDLRPLNGTDSAVARFLEQEEMVNKMIADITTFLEQWIPHFQNDQRSYLTVAIGCTGGQHRSVYITEQLFHHFNLGSFTSHKRHRELNHS
ncbi:MAG: RNase adapter RapZ [Gammaproteobacteria bacterium]|nr:RNase adapter RapZ [Gammaproteobacteria bacterium]